MINCCCSTDGWFESTITGLPPLNRPQEKDEGDIILGYRCFIVNWLVYHNEDINDSYKEKQDQVIAAAGITNFHTWNVYNSSHQVKSQVITGIFSAVPEKEWGPTPFIACRGTVSLDDAVNDVEGFIRQPFYTLRNSRGVYRRPLGYTGRGFILKHVEVRSVKHPILRKSIIQYAREVNQQYGHIIVTGHSLGGALATLMASELRADYPEFAYTLKLVVFGCPRVFDLKTTLKLDQKYTRVGDEINNIRFVNEEDVITMLPLYTHNLLFHMGDVFYAKTNDAEGFKRREYTFNFAPDLDNTSLLTDFGDIAKFLYHGARAHTPESSAGYFAHLSSSVLYQKGVERLLLQEFFEKIPIELHSFTNIIDYSERKAKRLSDAAIKGVEDVAVSALHMEL